MPDSFDQNPRGRFDPLKFWSKSEDEIQREADLAYEELGIDPDALRFRTVRGSVEPGGRQLHLSPLIYDRENRLSQRTGNVTLPLFFERRQPVKTAIRCDPNASRSFAKTK